MIDPTEFERAAMRSCLKFFGEAAGEIGFDKPLGHYSEAEALAVIEAIVTGWTEAMVAHHEQVKISPVRGLTPYETQATTPAIDPAHPFADLEEDLPWKTTAAASATKPGRKK